VTDTKLELDEDEITYIYRQIASKQEAKGFEKLSVVEQNLINHIVYKIAEAMEALEE